MNASKMTVLAGLVTLMAAGSAMAASPLVVTGSTVNFTGEVTDGACAITVNSVDQTVKLAVVPASSIVKGATPKQLTPFYITLEDCAIDTYTTASFDFAGANVDAGVALDNIATQNKALGVGVQLLDSANKVITIGTTGQGAKMNLAAGTSNTASFKAGIYGTAVGGVTSGNVVALTNFNIRYE